MKIGLSIKFIAAVTFLIIIHSAALSFYYIRSIQQTILEQMLKRGEALSRNFAYNSTYAVLMEESPSITISLFYRLFSGVMKEKDILYAGVFGKDGKIISQKNYSDYVFAPDEEKAHTQNVLQTADLCKRFFRLSKGPRVFDVYDIAYPIFSEDNVSAQNPNPREPTKADIIGFVRIGLSMETVDHEIRQMKTGTIWLTLLVIGLSTVMTFLLIRIITQPINQLAHAARSIASGDLDISLDMKKRNDEIGELLLAFRRMLKEIGNYEIQVEEYSHTLEQKVEERTRELRDMQDQLLQAEKLAAIGQLAAGVAHELNNPVGGILGYAQYIQGLLKPGAALTGDQRNNLVKYVQFIEKESQRCKTIVQNLLNFSRFSKTDMHPFEINTVITDTLQFLDHQFRSGNIRIDLKLATPSPVVHGSPNHIQQVFINILINAVQAMPTGGQIRVTTAVAGGQPSGEKPIVEIGVTDTGSGIPEEHLHKIFEPFFTTKETGKGTGLGLSVSYGIVKNHQGEIKVRSTVGKGTTFLIQLPCSM